MKFIRNNRILPRHLILLALGCTTLLIPLLLKSFVDAATKADRYAQAESVPAKPVAVVFGAGVYADGTPSPMLADRVNGTVELYRQGKIRKLLMTGDNSTHDYDEVSTITHAVLVTQRYHLPRAIYTCRQLGIDALGLGTPDWETYGAWIMVPCSLRELISTVKAVWQVNITRPRPTF